ncbi:MAG: RES family NAD+ phosphorylase [Burkholderiales bacterium]|nr:RES family NAD+ phosphorylase [Opitutaceae bacterium]
MPKAWRVVKTDYAASALSGDGARRVGGRWNPPGLPALYASDSLALAMLEILVHFDPAMPMADYVALELDLPEEKILTLRPHALPGGWPGRDSVPFTQQMGKNLLVGRSAFAFRVPSAVVAPESNYIINPTHPEFATWLPRQLARPPIPLSFDPRLVAQRARVAGNKSL